MTAGVFLNVSVLPSEAVALCNLELTYLARLAGLGSPDSLPPQCRGSNSVSVCWPASYSGCVSGEDAEDGRCAGSLSETSLRTAICERTRKIKKTWWPGKC